jgi:hypothetical protein
MMFFSKKKSKPNPDFIPPSEQPKKCEHKYKDFRWYLTWNITPSHYHIYIKEPYVCIYCGNRIDKVLTEYEGDNGNGGYKLVKELREKFPNQITSREIIEDEINDMILVDKEYLKWYNLLKNQSSIEPIKLQH